jgi:indolepyruvate ferredoxin oxidoreductase alpha subunit|tara:strand:+ start:1001 stop:4372 length:3372 start_codon:yes stop_codon:yes gene_type:complete
MGNEATARAAIEAGVQGVFSYPGTPSTEISEIFSTLSSFDINSVDRTLHPQYVPYPVYFEYSVNEKVALEKAIAFSIGHKSALCCMKNVGMNVASDALMTVAYQKIYAPLVIIVCDDPGCHSSSNEQDSRHWGRMASVPLFNPAHPEDAYQMAKEAFLLSAEIQLPVIVRLTTRVSHTRSTVGYNGIQLNQNPGAFKRAPVQINIPARNADAHQQLVDKVHSEKFQRYFWNNNSLTSSSSSNLYGVISSGVSAVYLEEVLSRFKLQQRVATLKLGLIFPFPEKDVLLFLKQGFKYVLILEELEPVIEHQVRSVAQKNNLNLKIMGKGFSNLERTGEYSISIVTQVISDFMSLSLKEIKKPLQGLNGLVSNLPQRPPTLCVGCPHRATYYVLKLVIPRTDEGPLLCGDIGCIGLGALPPLKMLDTVNHMGMSIPMAQGLSEAIDHQHPNGVIAIVGDGTFFHSGIPALLNAVYTKANITVIIFDNRTIAMTGGQDHPGSAKHQGTHNVEIEGLVRGVGVESVSTVDPFNVKQMFSTLKEVISHQGVSVVVAQSPCIKIDSPLLPDRSQMKVVVDHNHCSTCFHHVDKTHPCSQLCTPSSGLARARAKIAADIHLPAKHQSCPANICNHGFFNSILAGDYSTSLAIIRDNLLFARTCGDICHRPCEGDGINKVPVKQLKKYVSSIDDNFNDFTTLDKRINEARRQHHSVAIIGAGPAGLSAAYDLLLQGFSVTLYEKEHSAGGLLKFAIPDFRMDKGGYETEIQFLANHGVTFNFGHALGSEITLDGLLTDYGAVILAIGLGRSLLLDQVEKALPRHQKYSAVDFLRQYNLGLIDLRAGSTLIIIGGGNSAIDAARTAKRIDQNNRVILSCLESREAMPAFDQEIAEALEEGVELITESEVNNIEAGDDQNFSLTLKNTLTGKTITTLKGHYLITAIGQSGDPESLTGNHGIVLDKEGRLPGDPSSELSYDHPSGNRAGALFVAGDIASGNHMSLIGAIGSGKKAAIGVRRALQGYQYEYEADGPLQALNSRHSHGVDSSHALMWEEQSPDQWSGDISRFDLYQPCERCNHCIDNFGCPSLVKVNGKVQIDQGSCTACGFCIDVCPNNAIKWAEATADISPVALS